MWWGSVVGRVQGGAAGAGAAGCAAGAGAGRITRLAAMRQTASPAAQRPVRTWQRPGPAARSSRRARGGRGGRRRPSAPPPPPTPAPWGIRPAPGGRVGFLIGGSWGIHLIEKLSCGGAAARRRACAKWSSPEQPHQPLPRARPDPLPPAPPPHQPRQCLLAHAPLQQLERRRRLRRQHAQPARHQHQRKQLRRGRSAGGGKWAGTG